GEGSFFIKTNSDKYKTPIIKYDSTDKDIAQRVSVFFQTTVQGPYMNKSQFNRVKAVYHAGVTGGRAIGLMLTIYGLMGKNRQLQIRKCVRFWQKSKYPHKVRGAVYGGAGMWKE